MTQFPTVIAQGEKTLHSHHQHWETFSMPQGIRSEDIIDTVDTAEFTNLAHLDSRSLGLVESNCDCFCLGDLVRNSGIPLFWSLSPQQANNRDCHVVTTDTGRMEILRETLIHDVFADRRQRQHLCDTLAHTVNDLLGGLAIPDTCSWIVLVSMVVEPIR